MNSPLHVRPDWSWNVHSSIEEISSQEWNACVEPDEPLLLHQHLSALESSGIASQENGYTPCHVVLRDDTQKVAAAAPAYLKTHSRGELGADLGHAIAYGRVAGNYFPKLQVEVPMVPFAGRRFLVRPDVDRPGAVQSLMGALQETAVDRGASSVQVSHIRDEADELEALSRSGFEISQSNTYLWQEQGDVSYQETLQRMNAKRRAEIRRQRRRLAEEGISFRYYRGDEIPFDMSKSFFPLYVDNFKRHQTETWLNQAFFDAVFRDMREWIDLSVSYAGDELVGVVFTVAGPSRGYTMYWGRARDFRYLYLDQVIYRGIERALVTGLSSVDFGGTGGHKAGYGLVPTPNYHAFWYTSPEGRKISSIACAARTKIAKVERASEMARLPFVR